MATSAPLKFVAAWVMLLLLGTIVRAQDARFRPSPPGEDLFVIVQQGENLTSIVERLLGSTRYWTEIAQYNRLADPDRLQAGQVIAVPESFQRRRNYAWIAYLKGAVQYLPAGAEYGQAGEKGQYIFQGDTIITGEDGFVSVVFAGNSTVSVQPQSQVAVANLDCFDKQRACVIELWSERGDTSLQINSEGFDKPTVFTIRTPYASAVVRGTEFDFATSDGNAVGVTQGEVVVSADAREQVVPLGRGVLAGEGRSVDKMYPLLRAPMLHNLSQYARVSAEDWLTWSSIKNAKIYVLTVAQDDKLNQQIANRSTEINRVQTSVAPGTYFVGLRGVDSNGLRGFTTKYRINVVAVDQTATVDELSLQMRGESLLVRKPPEIPLGERYELHVGHRLEQLGGKPALVEYRSYELGSGRFYHIDVDITRDTYVTYRKIVDPATVSRYRHVELVATGRSR